MARYDERLETFFARYGEVLTTGDLPAIAGCYAVPALVLSRTGSVPIATREQIEAAFRGAAEGYKAQGLVATRPTLLCSEAIAEWLVSADVHWEYLHERGHSVHRDDYHYDYRYVLRLDNEAGPQIQVVLEMPAR
jgi:hypothetical protein